MPHNDHLATLPPPLNAGTGRPLDVAVIGGGIAGLSAAWLLSQRHRVTLFEAEPRLGGHSHTVDTALGDRLVPVDTGFIVYNEPAYPNLTALFAHLGVGTQASDMSFAVSLDGGALEYAGTDLRGLFAQRRNLLRPRFWSMLRDLLRFYREAPREAAQFGHLPLDSYLRARGYSRAFREDHLYPMAAAIWSTPAACIGDYPTQAFIRFCENHHLLRIGNRPVWRTVSGGSRQYVDKLARAFRNRVSLAAPAEQLRRGTHGVAVHTARQGELPGLFDHVVIATHADQALRLLPDASADERRLLGAFRYTRNHAVLHSDARLMPARRAVWASWNYIARRASAAPPCVTYWMNRLQGIPAEHPLFLTLNPAPDQTPADARILHSQIYEHPFFDTEALQAQRQLWTLQGRQRTWFCGAYFGAGFHEDGLQAGLAVAEALGGVRRPWQVANPSGRIHVLPRSGVVP